MSLARQTAQGVYDAAQSQVTAADTTVANTTKRVSDASAVAAAALKTQQEKEQAHAAATNNLANLKTVIAALTGAVAKANEAVAVTGGDKELQAAADALKTLTDKKTTEAVATEKLIVTRKTELTTAQQAYTAAQKVVVDAETALAAAQKVQADAVVTRKPTETALAASNAALAAADNSVRDATAAVDQIQQQVVQLQNPS